MIYNEIPFDSLVDSGVGKDESEIVIIMLGYYILKFVDYIPYSLKFSQAINFTFSRKLMDRENFIRENNSHTHHV